MAKKIVKQYTGPAMTLTKAIALGMQYEKCPKCGCDCIGGGKGTLEIDTEIGYFKRSCHCGWSVEIGERRG